MLGQGFQEHSIERQELRPRLLSQPQIARVVSGKSGLYGQCDRLLVVYFSNLYG